MINGSEIRKIYFSPCHPIFGVGKYLKDDFLRKSNPGVLLQAWEEFLIDPKKSLLIGDKATDILAGIAAGVGTNLLFASRRPNELNGFKYELIQTLREAIPYLQRDMQ